MQYENQLLCAEKTEDILCEDGIDVFQFELKKPEDIYMYSEGKSGGAFVTAYLYEKELFSGIRFPVGKLWEDLLTTPKVIFGTEKVAVVDFELYYYYYNPQSSTKRAWTPSNLDVLEVIEFNLDFFSEYKETNLLKQTVRSYFGNISHQYDCVKKSNLEIAEKKEYERLLRSKLKRAMWKYRKMKVVSIPEDGSIYGVAWPVLMHCYWVMFSQWNKIKKLLGFN